MPYVRRDKDGNVVGSDNLEQFPGQEFVADDAQDLLDHLGLSLEKLRAAKIESLKAAARGFLAGEIGDYGDNIADAIRCMVLGRAIANGSVTDEAVVARYDSYCALLLAGYGGAAAVMDVLEEDAKAFVKYVVEAYYPAKAAAISAKDIEEVEAVTLAP